MNGTKLSGFLLGFSVGGFPVLDLFEDVAMGGEELVVFGLGLRARGSWRKGRMSSTCSAQLARRSR